MSGRPDRLRLGDTVRFDGQLYDIVGLDGAGVLLQTREGRTSVITIAALAAHLRIDFRQFVGDEGRKVAGLSCSGSPARIRRSSSECGPKGARV